MKTRRYAFECDRCPRLSAALAADRQRCPNHVAQPIGPRGPRTARLLVVGLAPGRKGANRTGLVFAGDSSGKTLFTALERAGFATSADPFQARLIDTRLTNAVKCWPPGNQPTLVERDACQPYLTDELESLWNPSCRRPRALLCLGRFAYDATRRSLELLLAGAGTAPVSSKSPVPPFEHGRGGWVAPNLWFESSFHPSRQNLNTGRLTQDQLNGLFLGLAERLRCSPSARAQAKTVRGTPPNARAGPAQ